MAPKSVRGHYESVFFISLLAVLSRALALDIVILEPGFLSPGVLNALANYTAQTLSFPVSFTSQNHSADENIVGCSRFDDIEQSVTFLAEALFEESHQTSQHAIYVMECENIGLIATNFGAGLSLPVIKSVPTSSEHQFRIDSFYFRSIVFRPFFAALNFFLRDQGLQNIIAICPERTENIDPTAFHLCEQFPVAFPREVSAKVILERKNISQLVEELWSLSRVIVLVLPAHRQSMLLDELSRTTLWSGSHVILATTFDGSEVPLSFIPDVIEQEDYRIPSPVFVARTTILDPLQIRKSHFEKNFRNFTANTRAAFTGDLSTVAWRALCSLYEFLRNIAESGRDETNDGCANYTRCSPSISEVTIEKVMPDGTIERFSKYDAQGAAGYSKVFDPSLFDGWWIGQNFPPEDVPACVHCSPFQEDPRYLAILMIPVTTFTILLGYILWNNAKQSNSEQEKGGELTDSANGTQFADWNIKQEALTPAQSRGAQFATSHVSIGSTLQRSYVQSKTIYNESVMHYQHIMVWVARRQLTHHYEPDQKQIDFFIKLKEVNQANLATFYGLCLPSDVQDAQTSVVMEFCSKGSLSDLIAHEQARFNMELISVFVRDLVSAMTFLHQSFVFCHGSLKSPNCLITSKFSLKVTDHYLRALPLRPPVLEQEESLYQTLLWTAPEILRGPVIRLRRGTREGDVYSFGIILQEILMQSGPFRMDGLIGSELKTISPKEIVESVIRVSDEPFRPQVLEAHCPPEWYKLMQACWSENPVERPVFKALGSLITALPGFSKKQSYLDFVLHQMERYQNQLEHRVAETTVVLLEEKRRSDELLAQMMPRSVLEEMQQGKIVMPEGFEFVTLAFTAVIDFAVIAYSSSPFQIVLFLNTLYSLFDQAIIGFDVYKVETIQDSYFIASGLPVRNGSKHIFEICSVSLKLLSNIKQLRIEHMPDTNIEMKVGLHTGPCVAGVIGIKAPRYCIFGDTVNTTSRMCSTGEAQRIQISDSSNAFIETHYPDAFVLEPRGTIEVKGKGQMKTFFLRGTADGR